MRYSFGLKLIFFVSAFTVGTYVSATHSNFSFLRDLPSQNSQNEIHAVITPTSPTKSPTTDFRPDGGFEFSQKPSKLFKDIYWLSVTTGSPVGYGGACAPSPCTAPPIENRVDWVSQTPHGFFIADNNLYNWRNENLSVDDVSFTTEIHKGKSYQFTGRFSVGGNYEKSNPEGAALSGHLVKLINGQIVAEEDVTFSWFSQDEIDQQTFLRVKKASRK